MHKVGAFLEAGGNKVFFVNGILSILRREQVSVDLFVGSSSSAAIIVATLLGQNREVMESFAQRLDSNKRNFYAFKRPHFPQNKIYKDSVRSLSDDYIRSRPIGAFNIIAARTSIRLVSLKCFLSSVVLALSFGAGINAISLFRKMFKITELRITEKDRLSPEELSSFIMGSSMIYPFIKPHTFKDSLLLEGALMEPKFERELAQCQKRIVIHTEQGTSHKIGDTFHFFSDRPIPSNILDYTNGAAVHNLHAMGESVAEAQLQLLKNFLEQD
ncbi:MAG: hypothetical protein JWM46_586 [Candidatus Kaiserbacteria bacterium]|nr:hypothetical protein [Candidatus Kaiserbacteria bacterium]